MLDPMTTPEAVAVLCLLTIGANDAVKEEEVTSMLGSPFFREHVSEKIGPHRQFLKEYVWALKKVGKSGLEERAVAKLKTAYPALQVKTIAIMTHIAGADGEYSRTEKELVARVAVTLGVAMRDVQPELERLKEAVRQGAKEAARSIEPSGK